MSKKFPSARQTEFSIASMLLRHKNNIEVALTYGLDIDCFYEEATRNIFLAVEKLHSRRAFIDQFTIIDELALMNTPIKQEQISELINKKAEHSDNLIGYVEQLKELRNQRKIIDSLKTIEEIALLDKTVDEKIELISNEISSISNRKEDVRTFKEQDQFDSFLSVIESNIANKGKNSINFGLEALDSQISLIPGTLHIISGSPGAGKTALVQQVVDYNAIQGKNVLMFSAEMIYEMLMMRKIQSYLGIQTWKMHSGHITDIELAKIKNFKSTLSNNIIYNDVSNIDISRLKSIAKVENNKKKVDLIVIDYLQLVRCSSMKNARKDEIVEFISSELLGLAKDLKIPVIALAQLNREWQKNEGRRPEMSNLAASSALEKDAASITILHRPGQFDRTMPNKEKTEAIIGKNRFGNSNSAILKFNEELCRFDEYTAEEITQDDLDNLEFEGDKKPKKSLKFKE